jgi:hypothetical protein
MNDEQWEWKIVDDTRDYREIEVEEVNLNHHNSTSNYDLGFQNGKSDGKRLVKKIQKWHNAQSSDNTYGDFQGGWKNFEVETLGRFPANLILSHADRCIEGESCVEGCPALELDRQSGIKQSLGHKRPGNGNLYKEVNGERKYTENCGTGYTDIGGGSRFFANFYAPKISTKERNRGLDDVEATIIEGRDEGQDKRNVPHKKRPIAAKNNHPTVKTVKLMKYLITLINPSGGIVIDPFAGTFSTGLACQELGVDFIMIEKDEHYFDIGKKRLGIKE